jgi:hypothetical protein
MRDEFAALVDGRKRFGHRVACVEPVDGDALEPRAHEEQRRHRVLAAAELQRHRSCRASFASIASGAGTIIR